MNKKLLLLLSFIAIFSIADIKAQMHQDNPCDAEVFCNNFALDNFSNKLQLPKPGKHFKPKDFLGSVESPSWYRFIAQTTTLDLRFIYNNCSDPTNNGFQAIILSANDCTDTASFKSVSNFLNLPSTTTTGVLSATGLVAGQTYFLLIDGFSGSSCDYTIDVINGTNIQTVSTANLAAPTVIYGPSQVCVDASDVTFAIPKNPNATGYNFVFEINGGSPFGNTVVDSFYNVSLGAFIPIGTMTVTANYTNNCFAAGPSTIFTVDIGNEFIIKDTITLKVGEKVTYQGDRLITYNTPNTTPLPATVENDVIYNGLFSGSGGCDTIFNVHIIRIGQPKGRSYILRPGQTVNIGGINYGPLVNCAPLILTPSNDTIFNGQITHNYTPTVLRLNCDSIIFNLSQSNACANVTHVTTNQWYSMSSGTPSLLTGTSNNRKIFSPDSFRIVIKDSVYITGKAWAGFKIFYDTVAFRITGTGSTAIPTQSGLINNSLAVTECPSNSPNTYKLTSKALDATKYRWKILRGGGTFANGKDTITALSDTTTLTINWNKNTKLDTIEVTPENDCGVKGAARTLIVTISFFPNLFAGNDTAICNLTTTLVGTSSTGTGTWTSLGGNPSVPIFSDKFSPKSQITVTGSGKYKLAWSESQGVCTKIDTVELTLNSTPQVIANSIKDSCNANRDSAFVRFGLTLGTAPYTVLFENTTISAGKVVNGQFQSNAFKPGNYNLVVRDANNCTPAIIQGNQACTACVTTPGSLQAAKLKVCHGDSARATYLNGAFLEPNDTMYFVLHRGDPKMFILAESKTPVFGFDPLLMSYNETLYISAVAGNKVGNLVDINDACFKSTPATSVSVVFYDLSEVNLATPSLSLCKGTCSALPFRTKGFAPYSVTVTINDGTARDTTFSLLKGQTTANYCPTKNSLLVFKSVKDSLGCTYTSPSSTTNILISNPVLAGKDTVINVCSNLDTTLNLTNLLRGADLGGTWAESSVNVSTASAFDAVGSTFKPINQKTATYRFSYLVKPIATSVCTPDTSVISVNILTTPTADAGSDKTITCTEPAVTIGGNTPLGNNISILWSSRTGSLGGNNPTQEVRQADTYTIRATQGTCFSTDDVIVYIDTVAPKAIIAPFTDSLTCRRDTITINGSNSSPAGISYLWSLNNAPFDNNPSLIARAGGSYSLKVTQFSNGCSNTKTVDLIENKAKPIALIEKAGLLNCIDTILTLDAKRSSAGANFTFVWTSNNNGFYADSTTLEPKIDSIAKYKIVITNTTNGCQDSTTVDIRGDYDIPTAIAVANDSFDCFHPTITLSGRGSSIGTGISYTWIAEQGGNIVKGENTLNAVADKPGRYVLFILNEVNRCAAVDTIVVRENTARPNSIDFQTVKPTCYGEQNAKIVIDTIQGGTGPYIYSLDGKVFTQRKIFTNLPAGDFRLYLQDAAGCTLDTLVKIGQDNQLVISLGLDTMIKLGDSLLLSVNSNSNNIKKIGWSIYNDSLCAKDSACLQQWVKPNRQTRYTVTLTDINGCKTQGNVLVKVDKQRPVFVPNVFRPSPEGSNAIFMVYGSQVVKVIKKMSIYDRWGEQVFARTDIQANNPNDGWNGQFNGKDVQTGAYTYIVEVEYLDGEMETLTGTVTLVK
jgi:gliding motility-associated-like protein